MGPKGHYQTMNNINCTAGMCYLSTKNVYFVKPLLMKLLENKHEWMTFKRNNIDMI